MPFAIWGTTTGKILTVLGHEPSTDPDKRAALKASGRAVKEVGNDVTPANSMIDPVTGDVIDIATTSADYSIYQYDPVTGAVGGSTLSTFEHVLAPDSAPGRLVSMKPLNIFPRWVLTLDEKGMPTFDADGNVVAVPPEPDMTPNAIHLLLASDVNAGTLSPDHIPADLLTDMNARLATVGAPEIQTSAKKAAASAA